MRDTTQRLWTLSACVSCIFTMAQQLNQIKEKKRFAVSTLSLMDDGLISTSSSSSSSYCLINERISSTLSPCAAAWHTTIKPISHSHSQSTASFCLIAVFSPFSIDVLVTSSSCSLTVMMVADRTAQGIVSLFLSFFLSDVDRSTRHCFVRSFVRSFVLIYRCRLSLLISVSFSLESFVIAIFFFPSLSLVDIYAHTPVAFLRFFFNFYFLAPCTHTYGCTT